MLKIILSSIMYGDISRYIAAFFFAVVFVLCPIRSFSASDKVNNVAESKADAVQNDKDKKENSEDLKEGNLYEYEKPVAEEDSYAWLIIKTIFILGALVWAFYYFFRFVTKKTGIQTLGRDVIKVLSMVPVGQNKYLQVIDLAGKIMVIGVSDANINLITQINDKDEIDRIRLLSSKSIPVQQAGFQEYLVKYIGKLLNRETSSRNKSGDSFRQTEVDDHDKMEYLKKQRARLKGLNNDDED